MIDNGRLDLTFHMDQNTRACKWNHRLCCLLFTVCRFSVLEGSDGYSLILVLRLLIAEPSLVEKQGL